MATFDQKQQTVTYQYNADIINFGNVSNRADFARQVDNLSSEISRAQDLKAIDPKVAAQAVNAVNEASANAKSSEPDKSKIVSLLETAGNLVKGATALGGLYMGITKAIEVAHKLF